MPMPTHLLPLPVLVRPLVGSSGPWVLLLVRGLPLVAVGCSARNLPLERWGRSVGGVPLLLGLARGCLVSLLRRKGRGRRRLEEDCSATPIPTREPPLQVQVRVLVSLVNSLLLVLGTQVPDLELELALAVVFSAM